VHVVVGGKRHEAHSGTVGDPGYERVMASTRIRWTVVAALMAASVASACGGAPAVPVPARVPDASAVTSQMAPPDAPPGTGPRYVAMGDSAAAAPLVPDQAQPAGCFKSTNDYPSVLARRIGAASFTDVTCSGARTQDLVSRAQSTRTGEVPPQLDAVTADTQLVTVTIGGNDVDLPTIAKKCRRTTLDVPPCSPGLVVDGVDGISQAIEADADDWSDLVAAIRGKAPTARVILVGYGTYVRPEGCFPAQPINPVDAAYFQSKIDELDAALEQVAAAQGVEFFDTRPLSVGHDMCAAPEDRYIEGFAPDKPAAPLHPNAAGAAAVASALAEHTTAVPAGR
jgi:lysophospholipase L1-like esterase